MENTLNEYPLVRTAFLARRVKRTGSNRLALMLVIIFMAYLSIGSSEAASQEDPFESLNRPIHSFNTITGALVFQPLSKTYDLLMPNFAKSGVKNVLSNINDVVVSINSLLQFKFAQAGSDFGRVLINSTVGIGGIFDVAGNTFNLEKHDEDFGQTLAHWGVDRGPYIVLPLLGPSTIREGFGLFADSITNPGFSNESKSARDPYITVNALDSYSQFQHFNELVSGDEYLFLRGIYLQNLKFRESEGEYWDTFEEF